jgi:hypothetical protein
MTTMELITYDAQSCRGHNDVDPLVRFNKSGIITINNRACKELSLEEGAQVKFHQDKNRKKDWYLEKVTMNGLVLKKNLKAGCVGLNIQSAMICKEMLSSLGKDKPVKLPIAITPTDGKYFALLTTTLK